MAELSSEEKRKIYEEEKVRLEAQERARAETKDSEIKKKNKGCFIILLGIVLFFAFLWGIGFFSSDPKSKTKSQESSYVDIKASIQFTGTQFIITNNDTFDWTGVELDINSSTFKSGYILKTPRIAANTQYTVGALQFAKKDGTRFNPITMKPNEIFISCTTPKGKGFYSGGWK